MSPIKPVVFCFTARGTAIGNQIASHFGGHVLTQRSSQTQKIGDQLQSAFLGKVPIVGVCATGILIRILAPLIADKSSEPPVVCVSDDGRFVIPLLGGHNGANRLAEKISHLLDARAVLTTGSHAAFGLSLVEPPDNWSLSNPEDAKPVVSAIMNDHRVEVVGQAGWLEPLHDLPNVVFTSLTDHADRIEIAAAGTPPLTYYRKQFALGVGCVRNCPTDELLKLVESKLAEMDLSPGNIEGIYSVDIKCDEPAIHEVAKIFDLPVRFYSPTVLEEQFPRLQHPSEVVYKEIGCHGVSEAACLTRAGQDGEFILPKCKSPNATVALAKIGVENTSIGTPRGLLSVVGIGPGATAMRSPEVTMAIVKADELVGYKGYLKQLEPIPSTTAVVPFELGQEEQRCRYALEAAGTGKRVALVCSGDSSIYAMNSLVMELLDMPEEQGGVSDRAKKAELRFLPGISAFQAASAKAGSLIGHDFCAISLSNLLTDDATILRRVQSAAEGDFVISFYNPASKRRKHLFEEAINLIRLYRCAHTPVLVAKSVTRPDDELMTIKKLRDVGVDDVDMFTIVIIGNSQSKIFWSGSTLNGINGFWAYSPRGYDQKRNKSITLKENLG